MDGKRVLVLGLGKSGRAAAERMLAEPGASVTVLDEADGPIQRRAAEELRALGARVATGVGSADGEWDIAVVSPGIPPTSALMRWARSSGLPVLSEVEFAFRRSRSPWVAVTGTNGKTTVTCLIGHLLSLSGVPSETVGNIGTPPIAIVDEVGEATVLVAEVSSFQLAFTERFHPRVAVLLNITPDHLDWHGGMDSYTADKARVFSNQGPGDLAVIVVDDPGAAALVGPVRASGASVCEVTLGACPPGGAGVADGFLVVDRPEGRVRLLRTDELPLRGRHNLLNALAAAAAALGMGAPHDALSAALRTFRPIPHRLQPVAVSEGVEYVDDSKATNPDAAMKALTAFEERPIVMLLGGRDKGTGFGELARAVAERCRAVVVFGEARGRLRDAFEGLPVDLREAPGLPSAVRSARRLALPGDVVLLSPACASFDEFGSYAERGEAFARQVRAEETQ